MPGQAGADLLKTEKRRLLDKRFEELKCMYPCKNLRCRARPDFKGVTDNARLPCDIRVFRNEDDLTEITDKKRIEIPQQIFKEDPEQFGEQAISWQK